MTNSTDQSGTAADVQSSSEPAPVPTSQEQQTSKLLERQKALVAMGRRVISPPPLPVLMQDAAALLAEVLGTQYSLVAEFLPETQPPRLRLTLRETGSSEPHPLVYETGTAGTDSLAGYVLQIAYPVVVAELPRDKRFSDEFLRKHGIRSAVAAPLKIQDRSFGSLAA